MFNDVDRVCDLSVTEEQGP